MRWVWEDLNSREKILIISYVAEGKGWRTIASDMNISVSRAKQLIQAVYRLMDLRDHIELAFEVGRHWKEIEKGK